MAFTSADITALESAIKGGKQKVRYADREVSYHSLDQMLSLLRAMRAEVQASSATGRDYPRRQLANFSDV